jgi:hypothetical protein
MTFLSRAIVGAAVLAAVVVGLRVIGECAIALWPGLVPHCLRGEPLLFFDYAFVGVLCVVPSLVLIGLSYAVGRIVFGDD